MGVHPCLSSRLWPVVSIVALASALSAACIDSRAGEETLSVDDGFRTVASAIGTGSCAETCDGQGVPADCWCDAYCEGMGDCCDDYADYCPTGGTCRDGCGAEGVPFGACWCDELCAGYGDCCDDFDSYCVSSCTASCGFPSWDHTCGCDVACEYWEDCCPDYEDVCPRFVKVGFLVDTGDYDITIEEIQEIVDLANSVFVPRTGATIMLQDVEFFDNIGWGTDIEPYVDRHADDPPHMVVVFQKTGGSLNNGAFASSFADELDCNNWDSPQFDDPRLYIAVIAWTHRIGACGYDGVLYRSTGVWEHISDVVTDDIECGGAAAIGLPCVYHPAVDYWVCPNRDLDDPEYSHLHWKQAHSLVHELLHNFSVRSTWNDAHWATSACEADMGGSDDYEDEPYGFTYNMGICPHLYDVFRDSYIDCVPSLRDESGAFLPSDGPPPPY